MQPSGDQLFIGKLPVAQAIQKLRTRLLDLSSRNRLISYKHPKGRCLQFVDEPNLNLVFDRLIEGKAILIKNVPEPPDDLFNKKRPDVRTHAQALDIDVKEEFTALSCSPSANKHTPKLQTLYYPVDLEKICRKLRTEARTVIEETGTNMLYLIFGFLEYYESDASEKPMLAPLLSIPVSLEKDAIEEESRTYQYVLNYSGEDIHDNASLREKLSREFTLHLPLFGEEDEPGDYFDQVQKAVRSQKRWSVRYQLTLGFLSFGKLAIWADLDLQKWPGLAQNPLMTALFSGGSGNEASYEGEDYNIDKHPDAAQPSLIYDADSAQHSAIIDVMAGKNRVINGPPGTGKSQTITNIIATALLKGKRVLFVSEKLAALEVVRHRLNQANLGHFCLELHSHKTQKKRLLEDLQTRLDEKFPEQQHLAEKVKVLSQQREELNAYASIMASRIGNELNLTVHDVFWRADVFRRASGDFALNTATMYIPDAVAWPLNRIEHKRSKLELLGSLYEATGGNTTTNAWWGFLPKSLVPGDEEAIRLIINRAAEQAKGITQLVEDFIAQTGIANEPSMSHLTRLQEVLIKLPAPPVNLLNELMPYLYGDLDHSSGNVYKLVHHAYNDIVEAKRLNSIAENVLHQPSPISYDQVKVLFEACSKQLLPEANAMPLEVLAELVRTASTALEEFTQLALASSCNYLRIKPVTLTHLEVRLQEVKFTGPVDILNQSIETIRKGSDLLDVERKRLHLAYQHIERIANQHTIEFDGTPARVHILSSSSGIDGLVNHSNFSSEMLVRAKELLRLIPYELIVLPITEVQSQCQTLHSLQRRIDELLQIISGLAKQVSFPFDGTSESVIGMLVLSEIASAAPKPLIDYRWSSMASPRIVDLLQEAVISQAKTKALWESLDKTVFLDSLPSQDTLKAALRLFRQSGDSVFNIFNKEWRSAKKLLKSISKEGLKGKSADFQATLLNIITWQEQQAALATNSVFQENFGPLYKGVDTDFDKVHRLYDWYSNSQEKLRSHPELINLIDLPSVDREVLLRYASSSANITSAITELNQCQQDIDRLVGNLAFTLPRNEWSKYSAHVKEIGEQVDELVCIVSPFVKPELSPSKAMSLLSAKVEFAAASEHFDVLLNGLSVFQQQVENCLPGFAAINVLDWPSYLEQLKRHSRAVSALVEMVTPFNNENATPAKIQSFFGSKLALDASLAPFTFRLNEDSISIRDWQTYGASIDERLAALQELSSTLMLAVNIPKVSLNEAIEGLKAAKQSSALIQNVDNSVADVNLPDGLFKGLATDLSALKDTLTWGDTISSNKVLADSEIYSLLTNNQAITNYWWATELVTTTVNLEISVKETLHEINRFGVLSWQEWMHTSNRNDQQASHLLSRIQNAQNNISTVLTWSQFQTIRVDCNKENLGAFVAGVEQQAIPARQVSTVFLYAVYWSIGRKIYTDFPVIRDFVGTKHEALRNEFAKLDREIISQTGKAFAHHINRNGKAPLGVNAFSPKDKTDMWLLRHELGKQKRHIPIRQLVKRAGAALQALKPCFMMGPLSVAQYLEPGSVQFDLIVMDEASQLRPEDALGAIARGKQLVVVGDPKQLPPTNFFDRIMDGDEDEQEAADVFSGSESILDICQQLFHPVRTLRWHYRSQHESLIAFSNHHFYEGKLIIFPSPFDRNSRLGVRYRYVKNGTYQDRQNLIEAQRVTDAVLEHIIKYPGESLGVVTLNQTQRDLIDDLLDKKLQGNSAVIKYKSQWEDNGFPFFVKNLENVQGDERDVIFISTTFGKSPNSDKVRQNFGPISRADGWRRLNVLFTRARRKVEVFSSMQPEDILIDENTPRGTRALRDYLEYVKNGILTTSNLTGREADSDFELSVKDLLESKGYEVVPQLGVAGFFIDLAVRNPDRPGEFLAAIECDGATYHSSKSARDRDRIRQAVLESLGWKDRIWRIWSTDWFYNPRQSSERLISFLDARRVASRLEVQNYEFCEEVEEEDRNDSKDLDFTPTKVETVIARSREDRYVEIGDKVTYCYVDKPLEMRTITLVEGNGDPKLNQFNDQSPLGKALLDAKVGEVKLLEYNGLSRSIKFTGFANK